MKLCSTTLIGAGRASEAVDALASATSLCDERIAIETSGQSHPYIDAEHIFSFAWTGRFDDARNESLKMARECGADFSCMIDSDESIVMPQGPAAVRAFLESLDPQVKIVCAFSTDGTYQRERFFRSTMTQRWRFRTHESIDPGPGEQATIPASLITWSELPKTAEQVRAKSERDLLLIEADLTEYPEEGRLWFYKGNSLSHLGRLEEAIKAYKHVADIGMGEGCAWACYCAARCYAELSRQASERGASEEMWRTFYKAIDCCAAGVHKETRIAELHWLRASLHYGVGQYEEAIAWAEQAALYGYESRHFGTRHGFMVPHALRDGPTLIRQWAIDSIASGKMQKPTDTRVFASAGRLGHPPPEGSEVIGHDEGAPRVEYVRGPVHLTVTSTALNAAEFAGKCIRSVREQTYPNWDMHYVACDDATADAAFQARYNDARITVHCPQGKPPLLENLLPIWRGLDPEEVIVWIDGDDWLAVDTALARVADAHARGMWVTYGSFIYANGQRGFASPVGHDPRSATWTSTHLKTFRAGLVQRVDDRHWRWGLHAGIRLVDSPYIDLAIDQAVMLPCLEMAGRERCEYVDETLYVYNSAHSFELCGSHEEKRREAEAARLIRSRQRYGRLVSL